GLKNADPQPWLNLLFEAAVDAASLMGRLRAGLDRLHDDLLAALSGALSDEDAQRLALALLDTPLASVPALQRRTRLGSRSLAMALHRLEGQALARRMGLRPGDAWLFPEQLHLVLSA